MNKTDFISAVAETGGITKVDAKKAVEAAITTITNALSAGDSVSFPGFGTFAVSERAARKGKNPRTGAVVDIPASKTPKFKAGKGLKDSVNS